jgi:diacylglycerol O-acyltransferase
MAVSKRLNSLDWSFLAGETRESMMHVGGLMTFVPPADAPADFLRKLMDEVRADTRVQSPWNLKLRHPDLLTHPLQSWVEDRDFDVEYHVRRSALPTPGDERELGILVSRLHSHNIDFHRPPWEVHFIEGLEGGRFAIYFKVHHALVDGYTGIRILSRSMSHTPDERDTPLFYLIPPPPRPPRTRKEDPAPTLEALWQGVQGQLDVSRSAVNALMAVIRSARKQDHQLVAPMQAPLSPLNQKVSRSRRFATQQFPVERLKRVARAANGTLNDVVLALCAASLRRFLAEQDSLPAEALTAMLPVNVRPKDDPGGGNAVGAILASLATDEPGALQRLQAIIESTRHAKEQLQGMSKNAIMQFSQMLMAPMLLSMLPGAAGRVRPAFNVAISNVPGPENPLYFRGFRMDSYFPLSIPFKGYALNITVVSYAQTLNFGFIGCRDALPHLQRLAVYSREALEELEEGLGLEPEAEV